MEIETDSYVKNRQREPADPAMDRALLAEAMAADAVRMVFGLASVVEGMLALVEHRNRAFTDVLRAEVEAVRARARDITAVLTQENRSDG